MRKFFLAVALCTLAALPALAQNTDIEALSGLQFNFGNPGARSLGMGGAFIGLADDASAAEANPAGLTILRKAEVSIEARNYLEQQLLTTSGTFPDLARTAFTHYSERVEPTFASFVYPLPKNFVVGVYYHEPLRNQGVGEVVPQLNQFTGAIETDVPNFYLPAPQYGNGPVSLEQCIAIINAHRNDTLAPCVQYTTNPFLTALDVQLRTYGLTAAWKVGTFSFGATARYQRFREGAFTYRISSTTYQPQSIAVQATANTKGSDITLGDKNDVTFSAGVKWAPNDRFSAGAVYKKGPSFTTPTFIANVNTNFQYVKLADTVFHIPDVYGVGISFRPIPVLTLNADGVRVKYTNLIDNFVSTIADVRGIESPFKTNDVTEIHLGAEYFFSTKIPIALRAGYWRDPAHSIYWNGPLNSAEAVGAAMLYPRGEMQKHRSIGAGLAWPRFQIDAAYDTSEHYKVGSLSAVVRF
jgi:long-subunit fatty acid transport protein